MTERTRPRWIENAALNQWPADAGGGRPPAGPPRSTADGLARVPLRGATILPQGVSYPRAWRQWARPLDPGRGGRPVGAPPGPPRPRDASFFPAFARGQELRRPVAEIAQAPGSSTVGSAGGCLPPFPVYARTGLLVTVIRLRSMRGAATAPRGPRFSVFRAGRMARAEGLGAPPGGGPLGCPPKLRRLQGMPRRLIPTRPAPPVLQSSGSPLHGSLHSHVLRAVAPSPDDGDVDGGGRQARQSRFPAGPSPETPNPAPFPSRYRLGGGASARRRRVEGHRDGDDIGGPRPDRGSLSHDLTWAVARSPPCGLPRPATPPPSPPCAIGPRGPGALVACRAGSPRNAPSPTRGLHFRGRARLPLPRMRRGRGSGRRSRFLQRWPARLRMRADRCDHDAQPSPAPLAQIAVGPRRAAANCAPHAAAPFFESVPRFRPRSLRSSPPPRR